MQRTIKSEVWEEFLPSPRHRKLRHRRVTKEFVVTVPEVSEARAPVAIIQHGSGPHGYVKEWAKRERLEYRWYAGSLWLRPRLRRFHARPDVNRFAKLSDVYYSGYNASHNEQERRADIEQHFADYLIIGGKLYECIGEPRYVVMTFGLGHNHGGTAVMVDNTYNGNIGRDRYFRITQLDKAVKLATKIAERRGDTKDLPIKPHATFEVRIMAAASLNPRKEHGTGDPFLNKLNDLTESGMGQTEVAFGAMALAFRPGE